MIRRTLIALLVGALLGMASAMIVGPRFVVYWGTSPVPNMAQLCGSSLEYAATRLVQIELVLAGMGAVVLAIIVNAVAGRRRKPQQPAPAAR
jgi:hypothetical protein